MDVEEGGGKRGGEGWGRGTLNTPPSNHFNSSGNISPEARHMYSPKVTCFYCEGYHMKQLKYMYIR